MDLEQKKTNQNHSKQTSMNKKMRSSPKKTKENFTGHWTQKERLMYFVFVYHHHEKFKVKEVRRSQRLFKMMSKFIKTRTLNQCRTQHHKNLAKYQQIQGIMQFCQKIPMFKIVYAKAQSLLQELDLICFFGTLENENKQKQLRQQIVQKIDSIKIETDIQSDQIKICERQAISLSNTKNETNQNYFVPQCTNADPNQFIQYNQFPQWQMSYILAWMPLNPQNNP